MRRIVICAVILFFGGLASGTATAGGIQLYVCGSWSPNPGPFHASTSRSIHARANCGPGGSGFQLVKPGGPTVPRGASARWETTAPPGILINGIWVVGAASSNIGNGHGWSGQFFWNQGQIGHVAVTDRYTSSGCCRQSFNSRRIGWSFSCNRSRCSDYAYLQVGEIVVGATEYRPPDVNPSGSSTLWYQHGWVRGRWPLVFTAADPSGVCATAAEVGNQLYAGPGASPYRGNWQQCPNQTFSRWIDTSGIQASAGLGKGAMRLTIAATNAAGVTASHQETLAVDNTTPTLSLSGPSTAPTTGGTQYVTATAAAGLSGVAGIACSVDGTKGQWYPASPAAVPVSGFGVHHVSCISFNRAKDGTGQPGASAPATWVIAIRDPSVSTISFTRIVGRARCVQTRQHIRIPAQWVTVTVRGHPVRVRVPGQTRVVKRVHCRPRVAVRRVRVHGHWVTRRVAVMPRTLHSAYKRVRFGAPVAISGWLGSANGQPLGGAAVHILTAPDNGSGAFTPVATVTTARDGSWTAQLRPGPSRLVKAVFAGNSALQPSQSAVAKLAVPASLTMSISPDQTHWGGTIVINGQLRGGWVPPAGELVVLRVGWPGGSTEIGHLYAKSDGSFHSTYTFLRGHGTERYHLWAATASESDYPYAPNRSRKVLVTVHP